VKYHDEPGVGWGLLIDAEPSAVWALVTDPATPVQFSNELQNAEWENAPDGPALGAKFRGYNKHPELGWEWALSGRTPLTARRSARRFGATTSTLNLAGSGTLSV
jgi:hypothetical protein